MSAPAPPPAGNAWTPQSIALAMGVGLSVLGGGYGAVTSKGTSDEVKEIRRAMHEADSNKQAIADLQRRIEALEAKK